MTELTVLSVLSICVTNRPTNRQTDMTSCRSARTHLKNKSVRWTYNQNMVYCCVTSIFVGEANIELTIFSLYFHHGKECKQLQTDKKIGAEFFSRRFSLMQGTILGWIDVELEDDVFLKLMTANFLTVICFCFSGFKANLVVKSK